MSLEDVLNIGKDTDTAMCGWTRSLPCVLDAPRRTSTLNDERIDCTAEISIQDVIDKGSEMESLQMASDSSMESNRDGAKTSCVKANVLYTGCSFDLNKKYNKHWIKFMEKKRSTDPQYVEKRRQREKERLRRKRESQKRLQNREREDYSKDKVTSIHSLTNPDIEKSSYATIEAPYKHRSVKEHSVDNLLVMDDLKSQLDSAVNKIKQMKALTFEYLQRVEAPIMERYEDAFMWLPLREVVDNLKHIEENVDGLYMRLTEFKSSVNYLSQAIEKTGEQIECLISNGLTSQPTYYF